MRKQEERDMPARYQACACIAEASRRVLAWQKLGGATQAVKAASQAEKPPPESPPAASTSSSGIFTKCVSVRDRDVTVTATVTVTVTVWIPRCARVRSA